MAMVTVQVDDTTLTALDAVAARLDQSRDSLLTGVLQDYIAWEAQQVSKIEAGVAELDRGEFASPEEVARIFAKHGVTADGAVE